MSALEQPDKFLHQELITHTCVISYILDETSRIIDGNDQFYAALGIKRDSEKHVYLKSFMQDETVLAVRSSKVEKQS